MGARGGTLRVLDQAAIVIFFVVPVCAPLPHVAAHVAEAQFVAFFLADRVSTAVVGLDLVQTPITRKRLIAGVFPIPSHLLRVVAARVFCHSGRTSASGRVLPLGLGGQAICLVCHPVKGLQKILHIVPTDLFHWQVVAFEMAGVGTHDLSPLRLRHGVFAEPEVGDSDAVDGFS